MKSALGNIGKKFGIYIRLPQTWVHLFILLLIIVTFFKSKNTQEDDWKSLYSNVFAGLITGWVIYFCGSIRQLYFVVHERIEKWQQELCQQVCEYSQMHSKFLKDDYDEAGREYFVGEMCAGLVCVGECALQSSYDKRMGFNSERYCRKHYGFNAGAFYEKSMKILESYCENAYPQKEDVVELLKDIDIEVRDLYKKICSDKKSLEVEIATAQRSVL